MNSGTLNIKTGVEITGNTSIRGGGIYQYNGTINMTGGQITGNTAEYGGGLVQYPTQSGKFTMSGGVLCDNTSSLGSAGNDVYSVSESGSYTYTGTSYPTATLIRAADMDYSDEGYSASYNVWKDDTYTGTNRTAEYVGQGQYITEAISSSKDLMLTADKYGTTTATIIGTSSLEVTNLTLGSAGIVDGTSYFDKSDNLTYESVTYNTGTSNENTVTTWSKTSLQNAVANTWTAGNDSSASNGLVRTFDSVKYNCTVTAGFTGNNTGNESNTVRLYVKVVVPLSSDEVDISVSGITQEEISESEDGTSQTFLGYYDIPEAGYNADFTITLNIKAMKNGDLVEPEFYSWIEENEDNKDNPAAMSPTAVTVSATGMYNATLLTNSQLAYTGYFDMTKGEETTKDAYIECKDGSIVYGTMLGFGITLSVWNEISDKGMKGIEAPEGDITFELTFTGDMLNTSTKNTVYEAAPYVWAYKANEDTEYGNSLNDELRSVNMNWNDEDDLASTSQYAYDGAPFNTGGNTKSCYSGGAWTATGSQPTSTSTSTTVNFTVSGYVFDSTFSSKNPYQTSDGSDSEVFNNSYSRAFSAGYIQVIYPIDTTQVTESDYGYLQINMEGIVTKLAPTAGAGGIVSEDISDLTETAVANDLQYFTAMYGSGNEATYATNEIVYLDNYVKNTTGLYLSVSGGETLVKTNYFNNENNSTLTSSNGTGTTPLGSMVYMGSDMSFTSDVIDATKIDGYNAQEDNATEYNYLTAFDILEKFDADAYTPVGTSDPIVDKSYTLTSTTNTITEGGNTIFKIVTTESATEWSTYKTMSYTLTILYAAKANGTNWTHSEYPSDSGYSTPTPEMDAYGEEDLIYFTTLDDLYAYFEAKGMEGVCVGILYEFRDCCIRTGRTVSITARMNVTDDFERTGQTWCKTNDILGWSTYRPDYKDAYAYDIANNNATTRLELSYQYSWTKQEYATSGSVTAYGAGGDSDKMTGCKGAAEAYAVGSGYSCASTGDSNSGFSKLTKYEPGYVKTEYSGGYTVSGTHTGWHEGNCLLLYTMESSIDIEVNDYDNGQNTPKSQYNITAGERTVNYIVKADLAASSSASNVLVTNGTQLATVVITITLDKYLYYDEGSLTFTYGTDDDYQEGDLSFSVSYDEDTHVITITTVVSDISKDLPKINYSASIGDGSTENLTNGQELTATAEIYIEYEEVGQISTATKKDSVKISLLKNGESYIYKQADGTKELGEDIVYTLNYKNYSADASQIELGDILPYNGDERGTSFSGGYRVTTITVKFTDESSRSSFVNGKSTASSSGTESYIKYGNGFDCTKTDNLPSMLTSLYTSGTTLSYSSIEVSTVTEDTTTYYYVTYNLDSTAQAALSQLAETTTGLGLYFYLPSVAATSTVQIDLTLSPLTSDTSGTLITSDGETQAGGDMYYNNLFYRNVTITDYGTSTENDGYSYETTALGSTASVSIVSRTISGRVWMDMDQDGVYNTAAGYEEDVLANVDVYLYSSTVPTVTGTNVTYNNTTGEYSYILKDVTTTLTAVTLTINGNEETVYPVIDVLGALVVPETTDDSGKYEFDKLYEGVYYVVFKDGDDGYYIGGSGTGSAPIEFSKLSVTKLSELNGETNKAVADYGTDTDSDTNGAAALAQANIINEGVDGTGTATSGIDLSTTASVTNVYYQNLGLYYYKLNLTKEWENLFSDISEETAVTFNMTGTVEDSNNTGNVTVVNNDYTMTKGASNVTGSITVNIPSSSTDDFTVIVDDSLLASDGTVTWTLETELALQAEGSNGEITYTFTESAVESVDDGGGSKTMQGLTGFVAELSVADDSANTSTISVTATNTQILYDLSLYKISDTSTDNTTVYLAGADFALYSDISCDADDIVTAITDSATATSGSAGGYTGASYKESGYGLLTIGSLAAGTYYLKETAAPDGYVLNKSIWEINISYDAAKPTTPVIKITQVADTNGNIIAVADRQAFTVSSTTTGTTSSYYLTSNASDPTSYAVSFEMINYVSYELPESGGIGTIWFRLGGLLLILLAVWMLIMRYRRTLTEKG